MENGKSGITDRTIRIEPDWNVKAAIINGGATEQDIRIEPDWNVKLYLVLGKLVRL